MPGTLGESTDYTISRDKNEEEHECRKVEGPSVEKNVKAIIYGRVGVIRCKGRNIHFSAEGCNRDRRMLIYLREIKFSYDFVFGRKHG